MSGHLPITGAGRQHIFDSPMTLRLTISVVLTLRTGRHRSKSLSKFPPVAAASLSRCCLAERQVSRTVETAHLEALQTSRG